MGRCLIGTVGYHNLQNHSLGPLLLPQLEALEWPAGVQVEEMHWGPIAIIQRLQAEHPPFEQIIFVGVLESDSPEGTLRVYRWQGGLPSPEEIQARVAEAVTGVISLENLLIVGEYYQVWPRRVDIVAVAPGPQAMGSELRPLVRERIPALLEAIRRLVHGGFDPALLTPLRGERLRSNCPWYP